MENKGNPDPSRYPSNYTLGSETNKIGSKWTGIQLPSYENHRDRFGKTEVRQHYNTGYIVHTRSYNGNTISTIQAHTVRQARLTSVRQPAGANLE